MHDVSKGAKALLVGVVVWAFEQLREHTARTAVVSSLALVSAGGTQIVTEVVAGPPVEVPVAVAAPTVTHTPQPRTGPEEPPPTVTETVEATATVTEPPTERPGQASPRRREATASAIPPTVEDGSTPSPSAEPDPEPEPTEEREFRIPEHPDPELPPTPEPTRTSTPSPPATFSPPPTEPPHTPAECTQLPEHVGITGEVCAPDDEVDTEGQWRQCLEQERAIDLLRCMRNPDEWFA